MIQVFRTDEEYVKWLDGQTLPSGIVVYVSDDETMYFSTNNIKGELKTYKCEKEEPIIYPPLVYSAKSAGSTITVNGQSMTLEQGDNITLEYPTAITSVKATNNTALTAITIPNTVVSIIDNAFTGCTELTDFRYNGTVEEWGAITLGTDWNKDAAFTVVHCTDGDVTLEEPIQYPPLVYSTNAAGSTITVNGETVTLEQGDNIELNYANEITSVKATNNKALTYIQIPNTVTEIKDYGFRSCSSLSSITIPDGVTSIGDRAFYGCAALGSITIPSGVTSISNRAFYGCSALGSITIPETVTSISSGAFYGCAVLGSITIPSGVTSIGIGAFMDCSALTDFNYNGTKAQWSSITLGDTWKDNAAFTVVHCTDGDVSLEEPIQHEYVDLGLPSGLKWAKCNVGAEKETDYGDYFMWGSTEPNNNTNCDWPTAPFNNGSRDYDSTYFNSVKDTVCPNGILAKGYDAAAQIMGGDWRMPTTDDMQELFNNTTNEWTQLNGVNGYKFTSKADTSKYIFIPAAGNRAKSQMTLVGSTVNVWSSSLNTSKPNNAFSMLLGSDHVNVKSYNYRYLGRSVRGVHK